MDEGDEAGSVDQEVYELLPEPFVIRECCVRVERPGVRVWSVVVALPLLDADEYTTKDDLVRLYRAQWDIEVCQQTAS